MNIDINKVVQTIKAKNKSLSGIISHARDYGLSDIMGYVSTGCSVLDGMIGRGQFFAGLPDGRFAEVFGPESAGKSTFGFEILKSVQEGRGCEVNWVRDGAYFIPEVLSFKREPGVGILIDTEGSLDKIRCQEMGMDMDRLMVIEPWTLEEGFRAIEESVVTLVGRRKKHIPIAVVWDTIANCETEEERKGNTYADGMASKPRKIHKAIHHLTRFVSKHRLVVVFVNQIHDKIGAPPFGKKTTTPGGRAIKFISSLRLDVRRFKEWKDGKKKIGINSLIKIEKSKICNPLQESPYKIRYKTGVDDSLSILDFLTDDTLVDKPYVKSRGKGMYAIKVPGKTKPVVFDSSEWKGLLDSEFPSVVDDMILKTIRGESGDTSKKKRRFKVRSK